MNFFIFVNKNFLNLLLCTFYIYGRNIPTYLYLPLGELIRFKRVIFMWKLDHHHLPSLNQSFYYKNNSPIFLRQNISKYILPSPRTTYSKRHCTYSTTKLWNSNLPEEIKKSTSLSSFKRNFKKHLLNS